MTEEEKLLDCYNRLSRYSQRIALAQIIFAAEAEENARKIARGHRKDRSKRVSDPSYALPGTGPVMEAVNG
jgi:hypothetical protein